MSHGFFRLFHYAGTTRDREHGRCRVAVFSIPFSAACLTAILPCLLTLDSNISIRRQCEFPPLPGGDEAEVLEVLAAGARVGAPDVDPSGPHPLVNEQAV